MEHYTITERRNKIIEILNETGKVYVKNLSELFGVSVVVIRSDLAELEKQSVLTRIHGGAITNYKSYYNMSLVQRANTNAHQKKAIGKKINDLINDNDTVIMNAGTTLLFAIQEITKKNVTIITNSISIALDGAKNPDLKIILLGGDVNCDYQFTYGVNVVKSLEQYNADLLIMSVDGIDIEKGISTYYYQEAEICRQMMNCAKKIIVAADYSKINRTSFAQIGNFSKIDAIITSSDANTDYINKLKKQGIDILIAK
ncbi:MAG: DeoR/GlpR transcriptional regulator [Clostridia bacterium]|nr:DeoR/GlpR transcriptional regulator [Clostridia bacterium]